MKYDPFKRMLRDFFGKVQRDAEAERVAEPPRTTEQQLKMQALREEAHRRLKKKYENGQTIRWRGENGKRHSGSLVKNNRLTVLVSMNGNIIKVHRKYIL